MSITKHFVLISGFRQRHGRATTGIEGIWYALRKEHADIHTAFWVKNWNDDFKSLAAVIEYFRFREPVEVTIVAYSWGVGRGAVKLARELAQYDIKIKVLYAIDGVYKPWFPLPLRSLFARAWNPFRPRIYIPNTRSIIFWRQNRNRPSGHDLIPTLPGATVCPGIGDDGVMPCHTHQTIDNSTAICNDIVERLRDQI